MNYSSEKLFKLASLLRHKLLMAVKCFKVLATGSILFYSENVIKNTNYTLRDTILRVGPSLDHKYLTWVEVNDKQISYGIYYSCKCFKTDALGMIFYILGLFYKT
jgi:hypothetical protein